MLAASPFIAAETAAPPAAVAPARHVFVVRVDSRTGKLVRREVAPPARKAAVKTAPPAISAMVDQSARAHGVDPLLIHSVIQVESNYDAQAVSPKGAEGLMQLTPPTARMLGVSNSFDPGENIEAGVRYLKYLQDLYRDDRLALAAYNAGPGAVDRFKAVPPYPETQKYVDRVGQKYGEAKAARSEPEKKTEDAEAGPVKERQYSRVEQFVDQDGRLHLQSVQ
jgi:soluble lytic murein transglycosylase-like protein